MLQRYHFLVKLKNLPIESYKPMSNTMEMAAYTAVASARYKHGAYYTERDGTSKFVPSDEPIEEFRFAGLIMPDGNTLG